LKISCNRYRFGAILNTFDLPTVIMTPVEEEKRLMVESIKGNNPDAFNELYSHYFPAVYSFSYKFLKSKVLAQECTQQTFIKVWERREHLKCELSIKSYLFTICKNSILKIIEGNAREHKFRELVLQENRSVQMDTNTESDDMEKLANDALEQLPPQRQRIFKLCKIEGKSYQEVAVNLGISRGTVRDHMFKATKSIKRFISFSWQ